MIHASVIHASARTSLGSYSRPVSREFLLIHLRLLLGLRQGLLFRLDALDVLLIDASRPFLLELLTGVAVTQLGLR